MYKLTVVIGDISGFLHLQEPVSHRSIVIDLTEEQMNQLTLFPDESITMCFLEINKEVKGK